MLYFIDREHARKWAKDHGSRKVVDCGADKDIGRRWGVRKLNKS